MGVKIKLVRNSAAEFLIFTAQAGEESIEVRYENQTVWLTQKLMGRLFQKDKRTISHHIGKIFEEGELEADSVVRNFRTTASDGKTNETQFYNLAEDMAIRRIPMTMVDWAKRLDAFLELGERDVLQDGGKVSAELARDFAETEFEKFRVVQDRVFESDFDRMVKEMEGKKDKRNE